MLAHKLLKRLVANQRFSWFGSNKKRVKAYALEIKAIRGIAVVVREK